MTSMDRPSSSILAGVVVIHGLGDKTQRLHVSAADSPEAIEHCIRNLFQIEDGSSLLLFNDDGIAVPLGAGLLLQPGGNGPESTCPVFKLEIVKKQADAKRKRSSDATTKSSDVEAFDLEAEKKAILSHPTSLGVGSYKDHSREYTRNRKLSVAHMELSAESMNRRAAPSRNLSLNSTSGSTPMGLMSPVHLQLKDYKGFVSETSDVSETEEYEDETISNSVSQSLFDSVTPLMNQPQKQVFDSVTPLLNQPQKQDNSLMPLGRAKPENILAPPAYNLRGGSDESNRNLDEVRFWADCAEGYRRAVDHKLQSPSSHTSRRPSVWSHAEEDLHVSAFDSTDARIESLYNHWKGSKPVLSICEFQKHLQKENKLTIDRETLETAMAKVYKGYHAGMSPEEVWMKSKDGTVPRHIFGGVWQRLMLGALCNRCRDEHGNICIKEPNIQLTEYNEEAFDVEVLCEEELLFRQPLRTRGRRNIHGDVALLDNPARWIRAEASADRLLRMGTKFFVHPLATGDAITAARTGMTKIDRYRHQYFVSLEVYSLQNQFKVTSGLVGSTAEAFEERSSDDEDWEPPRVGPNVMRSSMFLVATGSPCSGHRDWLLSFVGKPVTGIKDPLDFFTNSPQAASNVLDFVMQDLEEHGRIREYQADFLLYTILDRAVSELGPICWAYGHRLRWMQNGLDKQKLMTPTENLDEVSKVRLEMQELKQWVGQMKGILKTLAEDCRNIRKDGESIPWNFGSHAEGRGKSLLMFLSNTDAMLEQASDRLVTLDDLARNFLDSHARLRDGFTNNILLALTISTAVYAPAQLLAGIYGTNFVDDEGAPALPELKWRYGYPVFVCTCFSIILAGLIAACCCLRKGGHR